MTWGVLLVSVFLAVIAIVVIIAIWQLITSQRGRAAMTQDETCQRLTQRVIDAQRQTATHLADVKDRVARIERLID